MGHYDNRAITLALGTRQVKPIRHRHHLPLPSTTISSPVTIYRETRFLPEASRGPDLMGSRPSTWERLGRCLDRLFGADCSQMVLEVTRHVVEEFDLDLSEIHNESTTVTFYGRYEDAREEDLRKGNKTPAVTSGGCRCRITLSERDLRN